MLLNYLRPLCKRQLPHYACLWFMFKDKSSIFPSLKRLDHVLSKHGAFFKRTFCKNTQLYSILSLKHSIVHDLCSDIDIDKIKADSRRSGVGERFEELVQAEVSQRLDNAVKQLSDAEKRVFKIVQLEHSFLFSEGYAIPSPESLTTRNWLEAMTLSSMEERLLYYSNLERLAQKPKSKLTEEQIIHEPETDGENNHTIYLSSLTAEAVERAANHRLASVMLHGSVLVVDMGYDVSYLATEIDPLVSQLWNLYLVNRSSPQPFHLVFTSCNFTGPIYRHLLLSFMVKAQFVLATFTEQSHTRLFPSADLVYLSSQSKESLMKFRKDHVYILGAYHDPLVHKKSSYLKAKEEKLRCYKLPIDHHVKWSHQEHKDLNLEHITAILLEVKNDGDWKNAFVSAIPNLVSPRS